MFQFALISKRVWYQTSSVPLSPQINFISLKKCKHETCIYWLRSWISKLLSTRWTRRKENSINNKLEFSGSCFCGVEQFKKWKLPKFVWLHNKWASSIEKHWRNLLKAKKKHTKNAVQPERYCSWKSIICQVFQNIQSGIIV